MKPLLIVIWFFSILASVAFAMQAFYMGTPSKAAFVWPIIAGLWATSAVRDL